MIPKYYKENYVIAKDNTMELIIVALILIFFVGAWVIIVLYAKDKTPVNPTTKNLNQQQVQETGLSNIYGTNNGKEYGTLAVYDSCPIGQCPTNLNTGEKRCSANPAIQLLYNPTTEECNPRNSCTGVTTPYGVLSDGSTSLDGSCDPDSQCRCINTLYTPNYIQSIFNVTNGSILQSNPQNINKWYFTQTSTTSTGQGNNIPFSYTDPTSQFYQISNDLLIAVQSTKCADLYKNLDVGDSISISDTLACVNSNPCIQGAMAYVLPYSNAGQDTFSTTGSYANFDLVNDFNTLPLSCVPNSIENPYIEPAIYDNGKYNICYDFQAPVFNFSSGKIHCMNPAPEVVLTNVNPTPPSTNKAVYVETALSKYTSSIASTYINPDFTQQRLNVYGVTSGEDISFVVTVTKNDSFYVPTPIDLPNLQQNANFVKINPNGTINVIQSGINFTPDTATTVIYRYDGFNSYLGGTAITSTNNGIYAFEIVNYSYIYGSTKIQSSNTYLTDLASIVVTKNQ
jgi:hypothetical protein